jgi:hypothetical protein
MINRNTANMIFSMIKRNVKLLTFLISIIFISSVLFVVVMRKQGSDSKQSNVSMNRVGAIPEEEYNGWQNYSDDNFGINFKYPSDWKVTVSLSNKVNEQIFHCDEIKNYLSEPASCSEEDTSEGKSVTLPFIHVQKANSDNDSQLEIAAYWSEINNGFKASNVTISNQGISINDQVYFFTNIIDSNGKTAISVSPRINGASAAKWKNFFVTSRFDQAKKSVEQDTEIIQKITQSIKILK